MKTIIEELNFLKKTVIIERNAWIKNLLLLENKLMGNIPDPFNAKEHYQSFIGKKKHKIGKTIKNNYLSTKNL